MSGGSVRRKGQNQLLAGPPLGRPRRSGSKLRVEPLLRRLWILGEALQYVFGREGTILICSIAFSFFASIFPIIVILLSVTHLLELEALRQAIDETLTSFFPISQEFIVRNLRIYTSRREPQILSFLLVAWAGSTFFFALEAGLDSAFRVRRTRRFYRSQLLGTVMALLAGGLALLSISLDERLPHWASGAPFFQGIDWLSGPLISFILSFVLFLLLYLLLPAHRQNWAAVIFSAFFASIAWWLTDTLFHWFSAGWSLELIYGPFYVSMTILLWAYAAGCILLGSARLAAEGFFRD